MRSNQSKKLTKQIGYRPKPEVFQMLQSIANNDIRPIASIVGIIVSQYLASTKGKLLKDIKIISSDKTA